MSNIHFILNDESQIKRLLILGMSPKTECSWCFQDENNSDKFDYVVQHTV